MEDQQVPRRDKGKEKVEENKEEEYNRENPLPRRDKGKEKVEENEGNDGDRDLNSDRRIPRSDKGKEKVEKAEEEEYAENWLQNLRKLAYGKVLRAFRAESLFCSAKRLQLMKDLKKELVITDDEHSRLLAVVDKVKSINEIRAAILKIQGFKRISISNTIQKQEQASGRSPGGSLVGTTVYIKFPGEDNFKEFVIKDYMEMQGQHYIQSDYVDDPYNSWIDLREMPPHLIKFANEPVRYGGEGGLADPLFNAPPLPSMANVPAEKPIEKANDPAEGQSGTTAQEGPPVGLSLDSSLVLSLDKQETKPGEPNP